MIAPKRGTTVLVPCHCFGRDSTMQVTVWDDGSATVGNGSTADQFTPEQRLELISALEAAE